MQTLKYKYRLYPTPEQEQLLLQICGSQRWVWNHYLAEEQTEYAANKKFKFFFKNCLDLTQLKQQTDTKWLADVPAVSIQQTLRNLERALKQSFKKNTNKKGFPKFKKKKNFCGSFSMVMVNKRKNYRENAFYISKAVGEVKCVYHRAFPGDFASCQIKQEAGKWFLVLTVDKTTLPKKEIKKTTGIDLNSKTYVLADGTEKEVPKPLRENQVKIKKYQRRLSRKVKGSKNKKKAQLKLQKAHQYVTNVRKDYFDKLSRELVDSYDLITIEDLDVKQIQQKFGHVIKDNAFGAFRHMLEYKAELYGTTIVVADKWFPSSQKCSCCGMLTKHQLHERTYTCKHCGFSIGRDHNAAINLNQLGLEQTKVMPTDVTASELDALVSVLSSITNEVGKVLE